MTSRQSLIEAITNYHPEFNEEAAFKDRFLDLLKHPRAYFRDHLPGHMTGSAWIMDESKKFILLTHHAKLNKWLQPGGHADGDENILNVAIREALEETGLRSLYPFSTSIFDIDIHRIPAGKDFTEHLHYDVRVLFQGSKEEPLTVSDESHDLAWVSIDHAGDVSANNSSIGRMAAKLRLL